MWRGVYTIDRIHSHETNRPARPAPRRLRLGSRDPGAAAGRRALKAPGPRRPRGDLHRRRPRGPRRDHEAPGAVPQRAQRQLRGFRPRRLGPDRHALRRDRPAPPRPLRRRPPRADHLLGRADFERDVHPGHDGHPLRAGAGRRRELPDLSPRPEAGPLDPAQRRQVAKRHRPDQPCGGQDRDHLQPEEREGHGPLPAQPQDRRDRDADGGQGRVLARGRLVRG